MSYESVGADIMDVDEGGAPGSTAANYTAINAPQAAAKPIDQIASHTEAATYAANGYQVSYKKGWWKAADLYFTAFAAARRDSRPSLDAVKEMLRTANRAADLARIASKPPTSVPPVFSTDEEVPEHIKSSGFMGGLPWWSFLGAGAAVYFLTRGKAKKASKPRKKARKPRKKGRKKSSRR